MLRAHGKAATVRWLEAIKANAAGHIYPDNETIASQVNRGAAALGIINEYYWYRMRAEIGAASMHSKITYFAPGDPGYVVDVSGAAVLKSSTHQAAAQQFLAFLVSKQGTGDHRPRLAQLRVPDRVRGDHRRAARRRSASCGPTRSRSPSWATARRPSRCSARRDCCDAVRHRPSEPGPPGPGDGRLWAAPDARTSEETL